MQTNNPISACSEQVTWKEEEMQLSQQVGGLRGELAALQAEKDDLINTCQQQKTDLHTTRSDLEQHKSKLQKQEEIESLLRKSIEQLEVQ